MNLLIFCHEFPPIGGGAANALRHLSRAWVRLGHRVCVVTSAHKDLRLLEEKEGVKIIRIPVGRRFLFTARIVEMIRFMMKSTRMMDRLYKEESPDLCVAFMTIPGGVAPYCMHWKYKLPFVTELRGGDVPGFGPSFLGALHLLPTYFIRQIWKKSRRLIANSEGLARLARKCLPGAAVQVIPNGVDSDLFLPIEKGSQGREVEFLFVGRFVDAQKNLSSVLKVFSKIKNTRLTLVGDGPDRKKLTALAQELGLLSRVNFSGWLKEEELVRAYQNADVYVSASFSEGMSNSALEAMACGLPLVLSDIEGHRELVESGINGYLFPAGDANQLESCLCDLRDNADKRRALSEQNRQKAIEEYSWETLAQQQLQCFKESLEPAC